MFQGHCFAFGESGESRWIIFSVGGERMCPWGRGE